MSFTRATKTAAKLRLGLCGPAGSGKTYSALAIATHLGDRIAVVDTEHGSASKYSDLFDFDVAELETFSPERYVEKIAEAENAGYDVLVIDGLSPAWSGKDGALELVDKAAARNRGNSYVGWREVTPLHNGLIDAMLQADLHIIATMRSKTEYVLEDNGKGQKVPRKIGMAPVQRDGLEYEFDVVGDLDYSHRLVVTKSRCAPLADAVVMKPGADFAGELKAWLAGAPSPRDELRAAVEELRAAAPDDELIAWWDGEGLRGKNLSRDGMAKALEKVRARIPKQRPGRIAASGNGGGDATAPPAAGDPDPQLDLEGKAR